MPGPKPEEKVEFKNRGTNMLFGVGRGILGGLGWSTFLMPGVSLCGWIFQSGIVLPIPITLFALFLIAFLIWLIYSSRVIAQRFFYRFPELRYPRGLSENILSDLISEFIEAVFNFDSPVSRVSAARDADERVNYSIFHAGWLQGLIVFFAVTLILAVVPLLVVLLTIPVDSPQKLFRIVLVLSCAASIALVFYFRKDFPSWPGRATFVFTGSLGPPNALKFLFLE